MIDLKTYLECREELNSFIMELLKPHDDYCKNVSKYCKEVRDETEEFYNSARREHKKMCKIMTIQGISIILLAAGLIILSIAK